MSGEKNTTKKRRSAIAIMGSLIGLVKPLLHIMLAAILLGTVGYLCAIFLTILAGQVILHGLAGNVAGAGISGIPEVVMKSTWLAGTSVKGILAVMILIAVLRGILHYVEQYCNHFIAFKLLAIIRHKVFAVLRKLCPAKLEGRDKGNLISIITTDIERKISCACWSSGSDRLSDRRCGDSPVEWKAWKSEGYGIPYGVW